MTSPAGVGTSPDILAQALPTDLSPADFASPYSWEQDDAYDPNDDVLERYVTNLGPGAGTTSPLGGNNTIAGVGTSPRTSTPTASVAGVGTFNTRNLPGRAATPPGQGYLSAAARGKRPAAGGKTPRARPTTGGKQPRRVPRQNTPPSPSDAGSLRRSSASSASRRSRRSDDSAGPSGPMNDAAMQRQLAQLLQDQRQTAAGRRIAGITTTNTITTTYKNGRPPSVTRNSTMVRN